MDVIIYLFYYFNLIDNNIYNVIFAQIIYEQKINFESIINF